METKTHLPGGEGEQAIGEAKRGVQAIKEQWIAINQALNDDWPDLSGLPQAAQTALAALRAQARFAHKVHKYLLLKEFGE